MLSVVAVGCYPDDVESKMFWNISTVQKKGAHVKVLLLTGGERGSKKPD